MTNAEAQALAPSYLRLPDDGVKITTSKDKAKVLRWAKKNHRSILWQDEKGVWHAAVNRYSTPTYAVKLEDI